MWLEEQTEEKYLNGTQESRQKEKPGGFNQEAEIEKYRDKTGDVFF